MRCLEALDLFVQRPEFLADGAVDLLNYVSPHAHALYVRSDAERFVKRSGKIYLHPVPVRHAMTRDDFREPSSVYLSVVSQNLNRESIEQMQVVLEDLAPRRRPFFDR